MPNLTLASVTAIGQAVRLLAVNLVFQLLGGRKTTLTEIKVAMPEGGSCGVETAGQVPFPS